MNGTFIIAGIVWLILFVVVADQVSKARIDDTAKAVWMLAVMLVPVFGAVAWWMVGLPRKSRARKVTGSMK